MLIVLLYTALSYGQDEMTFSQKICFRFTAAVSSETRDPIDTLKINCLKETGQYTEGMDLDTDEVDTMVVKILNKEGNCLICKYDSIYKTYQEEHFYKRAIAEGTLELFDDFLTETDYPVDFNTIQMRNGEPETLLDFLDMKIRKTVHPNVRDELQNLRILLYKKGARKASELAELPGICKE